MLVKGMLSKVASIWYIWFIFQSRWTTLLWKKHTIKMLINMHIV